MEKKKKERPIFQSFGDDMPDSSKSDKKSKEEKISVLTYHEDDDSRRVFSNLDLME